MREAHEIITGIIISQGFASKHNIFLKTVKYLRTLRNDFGEKLLTN